MKGETEEGFCSWKEEGDEVCQVCAPAGGEKRPVGGGRAGRGERRTDGTQGKGASRPSKGRNVATGAFLGLLAPAEAERRGGELPGAWVASAGD